MGRDIISIDGLAPPKHYEDQDKTVLNLQYKYDESLKEITEALKRETKTKRLIDIKKESEKRDYLSATPKKVAISPDEYEKLRKAKKELEELKIMLSNNNNNKKEV